MATAVQEFHLFPELPTELREEIWRLCLPERVCELTLPFDDVVFHEYSFDGPWPCELYHTTRMNGRPPLITQVCHEARSVALKTGGIQPEWYRDSTRPLEAQWHGLNIDDVWQDFARDSVHLNWTADYEGFYGHSEKRNPSEFLAWEASRFCRGGSLMINYLDKRYGYPDPFADLSDSDWGNLVLVPLSERMLWPLSPSKQKDLDALTKIAELRVVMRVIVIHCSIQTAIDSGLFGLLGDARVQIVDISDDARNAMYIQLAKTSESKNHVRIHQDFDLESAAAIRQTLRAIVMEEFHSAELAAAIQPAIMYRLCTRMCNHVGYKDRTQGEFRHDGTGYGQQRPAQA
jgi:hypothetical protein